MEDARSSIGTLIAEIGGSSSRWAWCTPEGTRLFPDEGCTMPGFNPLNSDPTVFLEQLRACFDEHAPDVYKAGRVKVYGAGCGSELRRGRMHDAIASLLPTSEITVDTDLMGAALGMCGNRPGLVLILGTGMNCGYFNGVHLHTPMPSLGYILGDEGSGADIGRNLLQDALYDRMPPEVLEVIFGAGGPDLDTVLEAVYRSPAPARELAAHTAALSPLIGNHYVRDLITGRFLELIELLKHYFSMEQRQEVHVTGSVAHGFRELLGECLLEQGMNLVTVTKDPLRGLVLYEQQQ